MSYNEQDILAEFDLAFLGQPGKYFPKNQEDNILYNFQFDLENGYLIIAGCRIHLFADKERWACVAETSGYHNRRMRGLIELYYYGNCITYPEHKIPERTYVSNMYDVELISEEEFERIKNINGSDMEQFELIAHEATKVLVRNKEITIEHNSSKYLEKGISFRDYENPQNLPGFEDLLRYLNETENELISATDDELRAYIPKDIPKIMTINSFHHKSNYDKENLPSCNETF